MNRMRAIRASLLLCFALVLISCLPTENSSSTSDFYTKTVTLDLGIETIYEQHDSADEVVFDSVGIGSQFGTLISFDDRDQRNTGVFRISVNSDSIMQLYFLPGAKEKWAALSVQLDSLSELSNSLFDEGLDSAALVISDEYMALRTNFDTTFVKSNHIPTSACSFTAIGVTTEDDANATVPLVVSIHTDLGLYIKVDQQASKPSGNPNFEFIGRPMKGVLKVTCPNPLK